MPDIKTALTEEIRRLARKEVKLAVVPLAKTISEQRKLITELKKRINDLEKCQPDSPVVTGKTATKETKLRLNAAGIIRVRTKLKLTQAEFARILGVSMHTVSMWELARVSPRAEAKAAICALRTVGKRELKKRLAEFSAPEEA